MSIGFLSQVVPFKWVRVTPRSSRYFPGNFRPGRPVIKRFSCCPFDAFGGRGVVSLLQELIKIVQKRPLSRDRSRNDSTWFSFFFLFVFTLWLGLPRALALGMICYYLGITRTLVVYWIPEPGRPFNWVRVTPRSSSYFRGDWGACSSWECRSCSSVVAECLCFREILFAQPFLGI